MAVARDDLGRAARKRGIEGQVTIIRHFGIRCIAFVGSATVMLERMLAAQAGKLANSKLTTILDKTS